ncbi:MAG: hypothetical protein HY553_04125 [Elusimicrobia bacterium]|nr:hypothetical protein [Elusimicrobiota bacterium]
MEALAGRSPAGPARAGAIGLAGLSLALQLAVAAGAAPAAKEPPPPVVTLKVHGFRSSVWVTIDPSGKFRLRETLPEDVARKPRRVTKRFGKKALAKLLRDAEHAGFFELQERYAESSQATTSWRLEIEGSPGRKAVAAYGDPPPAFQAVVDRIEELYGKPLLPDLARGARRSAEPPTRPFIDTSPTAAPKDDRSKEWED